MSFHLSWQSIDDGAMSSVALRRLGWSPARPAPVNDARGRLRLPATVDTDATFTPTKSVAGAAV